MLTGIWPCPLPSGMLAREYFIAFDKGRGAKVLMIPPLFDEHNKLRHQMIAVMRLLDQAGIDSVLPDCPGWNESVQPMHEQTLAGWQDALEAAYAFGDATHVLTWRGGALLAPRDLPGWRYAPVGGSKLLRGMMRSRTIAAREAGREEKISDIARVARERGVELAGWQLGPVLFRELEKAEPLPTESQHDIHHSAIGGAGLWLRAEPGFDAAQAQTLTAKVLRSLA